MKETLSLYTPSTMDQELLEAIFVQREKLLEKSIRWIQESLTTTKKNHLLFVGPRGSGKTHLITMIINRLKSDASLKDKMILAWIGEDDVIMHFLDLTLSIFRAIGDGCGLQESILDEARSMQPDDAATFILGAISRAIGDKTLLVVKENMNEVFAGLKDDGQKRLRAFLQEQKNMVLLSTSQQLFEGVSSRDAAFFGFFDIHHLKPLSIDDAVTLIGKIARLKGDTALHDFVHSAQGRYRVRALHHLAGGNHRLYMDLLEFLTMESLDDLVSALEKLADNLTPYFQERIKSLPPQQAKIVQKLCSIEGALPVKSLAEALFIGERSMAKQLGELLKKNYVLAHKRGKQTYYEIAEPLMRLSLEVKHNHGEPLTTLVLLLRAWFDDKEPAAYIQEPAPSHTRRHTISTDTWPLDIHTKITHLIDMPHRWTVEVKDLVKLAKEHKQTADLGQALMKSIEPFAAIDPKRSQLDAWIEIWEQEAGELAYMQTPLRALRAAADALAAGNDKPLFALPKEIRDLMLPLIEGALKNK